MRRGFWAAGGIFALTACWMAACRALPAAADWWLLRVMGPAAGTLGRASAALPFPLAEPLALLLAASAALGLLRALVGGPRRLLHWLRACALGLAVLAAGYALLWYPAYFAPSARPYPVFPAADAPRLHALCRELIARLNEADPCDDFDPLSRAAEGVASLEELPFAALVPAREARYPEWMSACGLSGLYVPYTAEALALPSVSPLSEAFVACHELAHARGVADEGQANIAAWRACMAVGGGYARSARLWALKYAMSRLRDADAAAWESCLREMNPATRARFIRDVGGLSSRDALSGAEELLARALGIDGMTDSYAALADYISSS